MTEEGVVWEPLSLAEVSELLAPLDVPWWICGGWAIDLFLGRETRPHADVDVAVLRAHQRELRDLLDGWDVETAHDGQLRPWAVGESVEAPVHGVWARRDHTGPWQVEFLLEERDGTEWVYRRDPQVTMPLSDLGMATRDGLPYMRPEVTLLYKATAPDVDRNAADFEATVPKLGIGSRCWLAGALEVAHPDHPWLSRLL